MTWLPVLYHILDNQAEALMLPDWRHKSLLMLMLLTEWSGPIQFHKGVGICLGPRPHHPWPTWLWCPSVCSPLWGSSTTLALCSPSPSLQNIENTFQKYLKCWILFCMLSDRYIWQLLRSWTPKRQLVLCEALPVNDCSKVWILTIVRTSGDNFYWY